MNDTNKTLLNLFVEGHIAFSTKDEYTQFECSLKSSQKKNILFDEKQLSVWLIN